LALVNDSRDTAQILTSSKQVWSKDSKSYVSANFLCKNKNGKNQNIILSQVENEDVHDFVLTNTWENLNITNTKEFIGFITLVNFQYWCNYGEELLIQNRSKNIKDILNLKNKESEIFNKIKNEEVRDRFILL
jgi:hypothetical protein